MKFRNLILVLVAAMIALPAFAQSSNSFFLGGSFTHNGELPHSFKGALGTLKSGTDIAGVDLGLSAKLAGPFGLAFDGNFSHSTSQNQFLFAAGPEFSIRLKNNRIFVHALVGGARQEQKIKGFTAESLADSSFAYELGGGWEKYFSKHFGVGGKLDYFYTEAFKSSEHNVRAALGIVIR